ncbi:specifically androgen-regulated gene protein isoform X1 [Gopherus flavomarginatus]|uniref:specifically androgen-regulated gene protein isoform X1 n=1 Tax=Gopherus flavomarginatus TaxID=286002 RepID=UPI0021CBAB9A|nr:specifically androgen-regulated gene protein isoform X1 [Gopherus flavomarginatus]XP_050809997.1 specifically androgen-regulated gene protein isoform X1 [Gopherus flavomarginatus]XP_050809998.1 specifically androgen-regulated gene protein isoform X1 [Gopherus flavomarginatus]XP_050809999.1 specifically androgen-regulated gene protein isoform X1 [Gopherus flavomarginatus]XP_050810000.1 specifically androgen-regulated gene protein isoform X1 [Gopherus flavomarginatus]
MPKEDLWLGTAGQDSGSCDSMFSTNSSHSEFSNNSYDYLSVEEKECLMFLEETIDSLDTEADSGVSADEIDYAERSKLPRTWPKRDVVPKNLDSGSPTESFGQQHEVEQKGDKHGSLLSSSAPVGVTSSGYRSLPRSVNAGSAQTTTKISVSKAADFTNGPSRTAQEPGKSSWKMPKKRGVEDKSNHQPSMSTQIKPSDLESVIICPPELFQDPRSKGSGNGSGDELLPNNLETKGKAEEAMGNEAEVASQHSAPENARLPLKEEKKRCERGRERAPDLQDNQEKSPSKEASLDSNIKLGPPTAPKPRKLPPNIILKPSKISPAPLIDPNHNRKVPSPSSPKHKSNTSDSSVEKQERARWEALEKLGLLHDKGRESKVHVVRPPTAPKPNPVLIPRAGSRDNLNSDDGTDVPVNGKPDQQHVSDLHPAESTAPSLRKTIKSNSLERSGIGLSSKDQNMDSSSLGKTSALKMAAPSDIRNNRTRPASLGTREDFIELKASKTDNEELGKSDNCISYPLLKFPRPTCVSVKITPKGATDDNRREALKKLGLLKE